MAGSWLHVGERVNILWLEPGKAKASVPFRRVDFAVDAPSRHNGNS